MQGPILVSLASFTTFAALGFQLTAAVAFPALALFNLLRFPIMQMPNQITNLINAGVGLTRIQNFLDADEMDPLPLEAPGGRGETAAEISNGTFFWESGTFFALFFAHLSRRGRDQAWHLLWESGALIM